MKTIKVKQKQKADGWVIASAELEYKKAESKTFNLEKTLIFEIV